MGMWRLGEPHTSRAPTSHQSGSRYMPLQRHLLPHCHGTGLELGVFTAGSSSYSTGSTSCRRALYNSKATHYPTDNRQSSRQGHACDDCHMLSSGCQAGAFLRNASERSQDIDGSDTPRKPPPWLHGPWRKVAPNNKVGRSHTNGLSGACCEDRVWNTLLGSTRPSGGRLSGCLCCPDAALGTTSAFPQPDSASPVLPCLWAGLRMTTGSAWLCQGGGSDGRALLCPPDSPPGTSPACRPWPRPSKTSCTLEPGGSAELLPLRKLAQVPSELNLGPGSRPGEMPELKPPAWPGSCCRPLCMWFPTGCCLLRTCCTAPPPKPADLECCLPCAGRAWGSSPLGLTGWRGQCCADSAPGRRRGPPGSGV